MKKALFLLVTSLAACQPASESRAHMEDTSDRMSDSILKLIDSSLAQPAKILAASESPIASSASSFTPVNQLK